MTFWFRSICVQLRGHLGTEFINSPCCSTTILLPPLSPAQHSPGKYETLPHFFTFSVMLFMSRAGEEEGAVNMLTHTSEPLQFPISGKSARPHFRAATISDQWGMNPSKIIQGLLFPQVLALSQPPLTQDCLEESMFKGEHEKTGGISPLPWLSTDTLKHQWRKRYTNNALETEKISKTLEMQRIKQ